MIPVEICIHSKDDAYVFDSVSSAWEGGADRIELCSHMEQDGLTPSIRHIELAREGFRDRSGLMVMIRPKGGDFFYSLEEISLMEGQISDVAKAGADGVVIGVLEEATSTVHRSYSERLIEKAREHDLAVTYHRAFDATPGWQHALDTLLELGVDRVLTSGVPWASTKTAVEGAENLVSMGKFVAGDLEIVVGGGVSIKNAGRIIECFRSNGITGFSLHTYSAVLENGLVSTVKVQQLKSLIKE